MDKIKNLSLANALIIAGMIFNAGVSFAMIHSQGDDIKEIKDQIKGVAATINPMQIKIAEISAIMSVH